MPVAFLDLFQNSRPVIGMVHTGPSPGVPGFTSVDPIVKRAVEEADVLVRAGMDGVLIENMFDFPCVHEREMGPEIAAFMTRVARSVKRRLHAVPVGIQVLFQGTRTALAVAQASGCDFVRAEGWTHAHISDKGIAEAQAGSVIRYRAMIGAGHIPVLADVRKKHAAHAWTADLSLGDIVHTMALHRADAVVVTGVTTGEAPDVDDLQVARGATTLPIVLGSGLHPENVELLFPLADAFIVGSSLKRGGSWDAPVDPQRVHDLVRAVELARSRLSRG